MSNLIDLDGSSYHKFRLFELPSAFFQQKDWRCPRKLKTRIKGLPGFSE
jgi:hypothetical protein